MSTGKSTAMGPNTQAAMAPLTDQQRSGIQTQSDVFNAGITPQNSYNQFQNTIFGQPTDAMMSAPGALGSMQGQSPAAAGTYGVSVGGNWWGSGSDPSESGYYWDPQTNQWARVVQYSNTGQPLNQNNG